MLSPSPPSDALHCTSASTLPALVRALCCFLHTLALAVPLRALACQHARPSLTRPLAPVYPPCQHRCNSRAAPPASCASPPDPHLAPHPTAVPSRTVLRANPRNAPACRCRMTAAHCAQVSECDPTATASQGQGDRAPPRWCLVLTKVVTQHGGDAVLSPRQSPQVMCHARIARVSPPHPPRAHEPAPLLAPDVRRRAHARALSLCRQCVCVHVCLHFTRACPSASATRARRRAGRETVSCVVVRVRVQFCERDSLCALACALYARAQAVPWPMRSETVNFALCYCAGNMLVTQIPVTSPKTSLVTSWYRLTSW